MGKIACKIAPQNAIALSLPTLIPPVPLEKGGNQKFNQLILYSDEPDGILATSDRDPITLLYEMGKRILISETYKSAVAGQRYREFYGNNQELASEGMKEVVKAADYQRIDSLFVAIGHQQWGSFDPHNSTVQLHEQEQTGRACQISQRFIPFKRAALSLLWKLNKSLINHQLRRFSATNCSAPKSVFTRPKSPISRFAFKIG